MPRAVWLVLLVSCARPGPPVLDEPVAAEGEMEQTRVCCEVCTREGCEGCVDASRECPPGMFPAQCTGEGDERVCKLPEVGKSYEVVVRNLCSEPVRYSITERFSPSTAGDLRTLEPGAEKVETLGQKDVLRRWYSDDRAGSEIPHARGGLMWFTEDCQAVGVAESLDAQTEGFRVPENGDGAVCSSDCPDGSKVKCSGDACASHGNGCSRGHDVAEDVRVYVDTLCPAQ